MKDDDRKKNLLKRKPIIGKSPLLTKAIVGNKSSPSKLRRDHTDKKPKKDQFKTDNSIIYQNQSATQLDSRLASPGSNFRLNVDSTQDLAGFHQKSQNKLN